MRQKSLIHLAYLSATSRYRVLVDTYIALQRVVSSLDNNNSGRVDSSEAHAHPTSTPILICNQLSFLL